jgi:polyisoprenyl-teichoic acid--peptidoglycan teichoic acid transferase
VQRQRVPATYRARPATGPHPVVPQRDVMADRARARYQGESRRRRWRMVIFLALGALIAGALTTWALVLLPIKEAVEHAIPDIFMTPVTQRPAPGGGPNATPVPVVYPDWAKQEPVNILLLGLDLRPQEEDSRADTMIVVHIDPAERTASMVSIPRDLWVDIPGHGEGRINQAFQLGEKDEPALGGGPGLAMATVEQNFDIKIHYFAQVDFTGFERVVDAMGGITIDVQRPLVDNEYPLSNYGVTRLYIPAGLQHMDGRTALMYARSRHADSDLGRNVRQQQVLLAIRQQGLSLNLISRLNDLLTQLSGAVKTDLSLLQVGSLAQLARQIDRDSIQTLLISDEMVRQVILPETGADVLMPDWERIRPRVRQLFADPRLVKEGARLSVQNGTTTGGIARKLSDELVAAGFTVADLSSARDQGKHPKTTITDFTGGGKPHTLEVLLRELSLSPSAVLRGDPDDAPASNTDGKPVDILVVAGDDRLEPK